MENCAVLHVEDDDASAYMLRAALDEANISASVYRVTDGDQAVAFLRKIEPYEAARTPELVVLDLNLPRVDGWTVLAAIRRNAALSSVPVVVLSGSNQSTDRQKAAFLGAQEFITKPFRLEALIEEVKRFSSTYLKEPGLRHFSPNG